MITGGLYSEIRLVYIATHLGGHISPTIFRKTDKNGLTNLHEIWLGDAERVS